MLVFGCVSILFLQVLYVQGYKPVIFMHGIFSDAPEADTLFSWIKQDHPGTVTFTVDMYDKLDSLTNMMEQVSKVGVVMTNFMKMYPDGVNLICFSQGGLVCRGVLEQFSHNVDTFISLSSPQAGQFGDTDFVKFVFPNLLRDNVYRIAYTKDGQNISVANYWNDPHHQDLYKEFSEFLALLNNDTFNPKFQEYKDNFLRLKRLVMIGGPDDGVIMPWQSSHFGFYDYNLNMVETKDQMWYKNDMFGLQSLDKRGGLFTRVIPGVEHTHWHSTYRGLVCRGVLEQFSHNVDTFISLSSPQAGQFGDTDFVKYVFPNLLRDNVYRIAYTKDGQNISVANYWNDPHHQDLYKEYSEFLAVLNNDTFNPKFQEYRDNFLRLKRLVMIGGPDDGVIMPWQSSHFGFYDYNLNMVETKDQMWYKNEMFGLQSLDKRGGLLTRVIPGVKHTHWHSTYSVYKDHILPFLS